MDKIVVTADHAFQPSGTGPAASPQESDGKKRTSAKMVWLWPRLKTTHL